MTREEQIRILTDAQERAFKQIDLTEGCEMGSEEFSRLVSVANQLSWEIQAPLFPAEVEVAGVPEQVQPEPAKPETAPEEVQPEPTMTKEDVRDKLSTYSNKYDHLDVAAIMSEMGYSKLSEIPATRYSELLEKVEKAVKEGV
jgi:hypothetical protein